MAWEAGGVESGESRVVKTLGASELSGELLSRPRKEGGLVDCTGGLCLAQADGAFVQVFLQHLRHAIRQGAHAVGTKPERPSAADAAQLALHIRQALGGFNGRGEAQNVRDEAPDGFRDGSGIGAGLGGVDEDLEGLLGAILIDGDKGFAQRRFNGEGLPDQGARARFLGLLPDLDLLAVDRLVHRRLCGGGVVRFEHHLVRASR